MLFTIVIPAELTLLKQQWRIERSLLRIRLRNNEVEFLHLAIPYSFTKSLGETKW
jgi:hypothetical protein